MNFEQADELNEAIRAVGTRHRNLAIAALAPWGVHPGHKLLLFELLVSGPSTQAQLAAACGYEPPTISLSVRQLEAAGLVGRRPSPDDGRVTIVELSDAGRALIPQLRTAWRQVAEDSVAGLTATTVEGLRSAVTDLAEALERHDDRAEPIPVRSRRARHAST